MSISVTCPNGHTHKVKNSLAGKVGLCPDCMAPIHVPEPSTEDVIMNVLSPEESGLSGSALSVDDRSDEPDDNWSSEPQAALKICPKCHSEIPGDASICSNCRTYIASLI